MGKYYLGIDLGTSGMKIGVIDDNNKIVYTSVENYPIFTDGLKSEQNPQDWWNALEKLVIAIPKELKENIASLSFSGQMHTLVCLDKNNEVIRPAILWNDTRTFAEVKFLNAEVGIDKISAWTGNMALEGFTAPKILWLKNNEPDTFNKVNKFLIAKDYLIFKMTGIHATDHSDAAGSLYYNPKTKDWSQEMLDIMGINREQLPKIFDSFGIVSTIDVNLANKLGLNNDVKVVAGGADNPVGAFSQSLVSEGQMNISLGTSGVIYFPTKTFKVTPKNELHSFVSVTGEYYQMGVTLSASGSLEWLAKSIYETSDFSNLTRELNDNLMHSVLFTPYLTGERTPINDPFAYGTFHGLKKEHTRKEITSAVLEGVAFSFKQIQEIVQELNIDANDVYISGGGSKSKYWVEVIATLLNKEIKIVKGEFGPFYGAALLARFTLSNKSIQEFIALNKFDFEIIKPSSNIYFAKYLANKYKIWKEIYCKLQSLAPAIHEIVKINK